MKTCIIMNPNAGSADEGGAVRRALTGSQDVKLVEPGQPGEATKIAAEALEAGFDLIVAAGGDGTVNEVINGLSADFGRARFAVLPLGTGNDLARTLALPTDPLKALDVAFSGSERRLDVVDVRSGGLQRYMINVSAGGFSGQVDEAMTDELKATWGPLAYVLGAAKVLPDLTHYETTLALDGGPPDRVSALNIIVANGRTVAGGKAVAPLANPEDGLLDIVVVHSAGAMELAGVVTRLLAGNYLDSAVVGHRSARRVTIASRPGMWFNVDGELFTNEPLSFEVLPGALRVAVGRDYIADPSPAPPV